MYGEERFLFNGTLDLCQTGKIPYEKCYKMTEIFTKVLYFPNSSPNPPFLPDIHFPQISRTEQKKYSMNYMKVGGAFLCNHYRFYTYEFMKQKVRTNKRGKSFLDLPVNHTTWQYKVAVEDRLALDFILNVKRNRSSFHGYNEHSSN